jgi:hypothetical protein
MRSLRGKRLSEVPTYVFADALKYSVDFKRLSVCTDATCSDELVLISSEFEMDMSNRGSYTDLMDEAAKGTVVEKTYSVVKLTAGRTMKIRSDPVLSSEGWLSTSPTKPFGVSINKYIESPSRGYNIWVSASLTPSKETSEDSVLFLMDQTGNVTACENEECSVFVEFPIPAYDDPTTLFPNVLGVETTATTSSILAKMMTPDLASDAPITPSSTNLNIRFDMQNSVLFEKVGSFWTVQPYYFKPFVFAS